MQEYRRSMNHADDDFDPEDQEGIFELKQLIITDYLLYKFTCEKLKFPELRETYENENEYKKQWLYLIQYEIFSKLLSQSSNKRQQIDVE